MADIHIERAHGMSLAQARKAAIKWASQAEEKFALECTYEEGSTSDELSFKRSGVTGTLTITQDSFELQAKLGFLLGAFKDKIAAEIMKTLDALIAKNAPDAANAAAADSALIKPADRQTSNEKA